MKKKYLYENIFAITRRFQNPSATQRRQHGSLASGRLERCRRPHVAPGGGVAAQSAAPPQGLRGVPSYLGHEAFINLSLARRC